MDVIPWRHWGIWQKLKKTVKKHSHNNFHWLCKKCKFLLATMAKGPWPSMARADRNLWLRSIVYIFYSYETWCGTATFWSFLHLGFINTCAYTVVCPSGRLWVVTTWSFVHCGFEIRQLIEQQSILTTEKPLKKFLFHQFKFHLMLMEMLRGGGWWSGNWHQKCGGERTLYCELRL